MEEPNISIRAAIILDIPELVKLNNDWDKQCRDNYNNGFLSVTYDSTFFKKIIENNDIYVFVIDDRLRGYVLVNTVNETDHIINLKQEYFQSQPKNISKKIAFSYQILLDRELQGTGFFYEAQNRYKQLFKTKYDLLVSTVNKQNIRSLFAHKKAGWAFIYSKNNYYIIEFIL